MILADGRLQAQLGAVGGFARLLQGRRAEGEVPGGGTAGCLAPPRAPTLQTVFALPGLGTASPYELLRADSADGVLSGAKIVGCLYQVLMEGRGDENMGQGMADAQH